LTVVSQGELPNLKSEKPDSLTLQSAPVWAKEPALYMMNKIINKKSFWAGLMLMNTSIKKIAIERPN